MSWNAVSARGESMRQLDRVQSEALPEAPGRQVVEARCLACHGSSAIREQRLSPAGWVREVRKMIDWGATVDAAEQDRIVAYLSARFGVTRAPAVGERSADPVEPGAALLARCLSCHELGLIEQQHLTRTGWTREVDKMIGWGASLTEAERNLLSDYLAQRYGPGR